jgi:hypothetical protein
MYVTTLMMAVTAPATVLISDVLAPKAIATPVATPAIASHSLRLVIFLMNVFILSPFIW